MLKSNKGITIAILVITIVVIMIITGTVIGNAGDYIRTKYINNIEVDISVLMERIPIYYQETHGQLPTGAQLSYDQIVRLRSDANVNDGADDYYEINLALLPDLKLYNGYKNQGADDFYCINKTSLAVYYMSGYEINGETYYTIHDTNSSIVPSTIDGATFIELRATNITDTTVSLEADFSGAVSYQFQVDGEDWSSPQTTNSLTFVNLVPNTVYTFRVRGIASNGNITLGYAQIMTAASAAPGAGSE